MQSVSIISHPATPMAGRAIRPVTRTTGSSGQHPDFSLDPQRNRPEHAEHRVLEGELAGTDTIVADSRFTPRHVSVRHAINSYRLNSFISADAIVTPGRNFHAKA